MILSTTIYFLHITSFHQIIIPLKKSVIQYHHLFSTLTTFTTTTYLSFPLNFRTTQFLLPYSWLQITSTLSLGDTQIEYLFSQVTYLFRYKIVSPSGTASQEAMKRLESGQKSEYSMQPATLCRYGLISFLQMSFLSFFWPKS